MLIARIALVYAAVVFGSVALPGVFDPQTIASSLGLSATNAVGDNELRAVYGGLIGGIALFFGIASFRPVWHTPALAAQLCVFAGLVIARSVAIAVSGAAGAAVYPMLGSEVLGTLVAWAGLRRLSPVSAA